LCNRVNSGDENDRYGRGCGFRRHYWLGASGYDYRNAAADEIGCKCGQPINFVLRIPILYRHVLALDIASFLQALEERSRKVFEDISGLGAEVTNHRHRRLLRPRDERPRRRAPKPHNKLSASHPGILFRYAGAYRHGGCEETVVRADAGLAALH
jgi:hypothetical protein